VEGSHDISVVAIDGQTIANINVAVVIESSTFTEWTPHDATVLGNTDWVRVFGTLCVEGIDSGL
jgi:hypothetical protein